MAWSSGGLQHSNGAGNLVFAQHPNAQIMAEKGNKVVSGCAVTEDATPDLTVDVAAGTVIANGIVVAVSADAAFAGTPNTFATTQGNLTSGQAQFVMVHVDSSGVITNTEGTAAAAGQQLPPDVPEDETILAMITLTESDPTIDTVDIEDWRQFVPDGMYVAGEFQVNDGIRKVLTVDRSSNVWIFSELGFERDQDANATGFINNTGFNDGTTRFRSLDIRDGKGSSIAFFDGPTGSVGINKAPNSAGSSFLDVGGNMWVANEINSLPDTNGNAILHLNFRGYNGGTTQFRDLQVNDGKSNLVMFVDGSNGNVGIGRAPASTTMLTLGKADPILRLHDERDITWSGGEEFAAIEFFAGDGSGTGAKVINKIAIEIPNAGSTPLGDIVFYTNPAYTSLSEKMRITSAGSIIFGFGLALESRDDILTSSANIGIFRSSGGGSAPFDEAGHLVLQSRSSLARDILFYTGTTPALRMTIDASGNVQFTGDLGVSDDTNLIQLAANKVTINGVTEVDGNIIPVDDIAYDLGSSSLRFDQLYIAPANVVSGTTVEINVTTGQVAKQSSSRRYKENFRTFDLDTSTIYKFPKPEFYTLKSFPDMELFNYMAEDVAEIMPELIIYDEKGRPDNFHPSRLLVLIIEELKKLNKRTIVLEAK